MRVAAFPYGGSYAEYFVADETLVFPIPESMTWETAAAFPTVGLTAFALLSQVAELQAGESVLVHAAAGGVGTTAVQMAKVLGAGTVIGVVGSSEKSALVRELGADEVIDASRDGFSERVLAMTGGGVDVVLDSIGGLSSEQSLKCLAKFGRLVHFGSASGEPGRIVVSDLHATCRSVRGFSLGTVRRERPGAIAPLADAVMGMADRGQFRMVIGKHWPLARAAEAHHWIESRQSVGKIILDL
jgi:NADPH2:quinone reductase